MKIKKNSGFSASRDKILL